MTDSTGPSQGAVNKIFGDAVPEIAPGERDIASPGEVDEHERWLRENVPPHHD